jgi:hypothetical protein
MWNQIAISIPASWAVTMPSWVPPALMGAGVAVLVGMVGIRAVKWPAGLRGLGKGRARTENAGDRDGGVQGLAGDLEEITERLAAEMDAKAARLEQLIAQADERLERLEAYGAGHAVAGEGAAARHGVHGGGRRSGNGSTMAMASRAITEDAPDPMSRQIYRLADEGLPSVEIARKLDQQVGSVELVLALRRP